MRSLSKVICLISILAVVYVLSIGPALALAERKVISKRSCDAFYAPLHLAADKVPFFGHVLMKYLFLWDSPSLWKNL